MWTHGQVHRLTQKSAEGQVNWSRSTDGTLRADHEGESLALKRADDGGITLMSVRSGDAFPQEDVLADESIHPQMAPALRALWEAIA
ncbi:MAG: hypothetical protein QOD72_1173 [Acidimicrobiaceae bacterium]|jgi:hypothetical protein|nr:hypothetical protein [Acidimicrobiaceae bacterium]